jgi:hypothetical protein
MDRTLLSKSSALATSRTPALLAVHDWLALGYLAVIGGLTCASEGTARDLCLRRIVLAAAVVLSGSALFRVGHFLPRYLRTNAYRLAIGWVVVEAYLMLRDLLPLVRSDALDARLHELDLALFGVEPSLWFSQHLNARPIIEWFSFCYFSYFFICAGYLVTMLWLVRPGRQTTIFSIGSMICVFVGHLGYMAVPGFGPVAHLDFDRPLDGGFFWSCVQGTVAMGGAMKDIFPSLHTALPTWFTLFAIHAARRDRRWRIPALVTGFMAVNIIASTMILRWHYAIDVVAGLALASFAIAVAPRLARLEESWRTANGWRGAWEC